jgi:mono/diheme cytochrome c family protein
MKATPGWKSLGLIAAALLAAGACKAAQGEWSDPALRPQMPAFSALKALSEREVSDLVEYVRALGGETADETAVVRAIPTFVRHCAACHGDMGQGDPARSIPALNRHFQFGDKSREQILKFIRHGTGDQI